MTSNGKILTQKDSEKAFRKIRTIFCNAWALVKTKNVIFSYIEKAKNSLKNLEEFSFKRSLYVMTDCTFNRLNI